MLIILCLFLALTLGPDPRDSPHPLQEHSLREIITRPSEHADKAHPNASRTNFLGFYEVP